jgi:vanillate O-demethylase monooxygenase subunit
MVINAITPEKDGSMHYFWGMARDFDIADTGFTARFKAQQGGVFKEDLEILEAQQRSMEQNPDMRLHAYNIDAGGTRARMVLDRMVREQAAVG